MSERCTCECGGHEVVSKVWGGTYEVRCIKCGANITFFRSTPENAETDGYLIWLDVINSHNEE